MERLAMGGMNIARPNICHSTHEKHEKAIQAVKRLNEEKGFCISMMIDTTRVTFKCSIMEAFPPLKIRMDHYGYRQLRSLRVLLSPSK